MTKFRVVGEVLDYLAENRHTIHYTGWVGYRNLGDEILLEAARESFAPAKIVWIRDFGSALPNWLVNTRTHELAMMGGGTQIGERSPIDRYKQALARSKAGFVFGAGVTPAHEGRCRTGCRLGRGPASARVRRHARPGVGRHPAPCRRQRAGAGRPSVLVRQARRFLETRSPVDRHEHRDLARPHVRRRKRDPAELHRARAKLLTAGHRIEFFCVWPEDRKTTRRVAAQAGIANPVIHEIYEGATEFQEKVRRVHVFVGIKLHACALAMCSGVPTLIVGYREKCREFALTVGAQDFCLRSDTLDAGQMLEVVDQLKRRGPEVAAAMLATRMSSVSASSTCRAASSRGTAGAA